MKNTNSFPILNYHRIVSDSFSQDQTPHSTRPYQLQLSNFQRQLTYLHQNGFCSSFPSDPQHPKKIILTFDDGFSSDYTIALPELNRRGFKAIFFIITSLIGKENYLTLDNLKSLLDSGMTIGSHSVSHPFFTDLNEHRIREELSNSKKTLEDKLGIPITQFSIPYGFFNNLILEAALEIGYNEIFTSEAKLSNYYGSAIYGRFGILRSHNIKTFSNIVEKNNIKLLQIRGYEIIKNILKKSLGKKKWLELREYLLEKNERV